jgi:hypothetical protein
MGAVELMNTFATIACVISVIFGATAIFLPSGQPIESIVFYVGSVWLLANVILSRAYTAEYWRGLNRTIPDVFRAAQEGTLPRSSAVQRVINFGSLILMIAFTWLQFSH